MILIICAWIYCFLLSLTIGAGFLKLISRFTGIALNLRFGIFYQFWFGFATVIGLLQVLSLFLPIGKTTFIILGILAALIIVLNAKSVLAKAIEFYHWLFTLRGLLSFLSVCFMLFVVAYSANREVEHSDTYIYHFNAVK